MRGALEMLTGKPFVKIRPPWLRNPATNRNLEIDAWNEELQLACEFQGYQHTVFPNCFHKSYADFERQQQRDKFKAQRIQSLGIHFLEVPHTVCAAEIPSFLAERLSKWNMLWIRDEKELQVIMEEMSAELDVLLGEDTPDQTNLTPTRSALPQDQSEAALAESAGVTVARSNGLRMLACGQCDSCWVRHAEFWSMADFDSRSRSNSYTCTLRE